MQCLNLVARRLRLAARIASADAAHGWWCGQHALVAVVEGERCLDEPALEPPDAELLELPHADEGFRAELVRVNGDGPDACRVGPRSLYYPRSGCRTFHRVDDARPLRRRLERIGAGVEIDLRCVGVADPQLEPADGWRTEHATDARAHGAHAQIPLTQIASLIALKRPQRAAQRIAENERRQRHSPTVAGDELAGNQVGVKIEIAHAATRMSKVTMPQRAMKGARKSVRTDDAERFRY